MFDSPFDDGIHLRLYMSPVNLARLLLPYINDRGSSYGSRATRSGEVQGERQLVIIDFSSPNLGQEFSGAHLRSTILGSSLAALHEHMGWEVHRMNFLGDWGKHIGFLLLGWTSCGSDSLLETDALRHLLDIHTRTCELANAERTTNSAAGSSTGVETESPSDSIDSIMVRQDGVLRDLDRHDATAVATWMRLREASIKEYADIYDKLNITFDEYSGESKVTQSTFEEIESVLWEKGIYENINGNWVIDFKKHGSKGLGVVTARHSNGTTSYLLRDLGALVERRKLLNFDKMLYVVSSKQDTHFQRLIKTLTLMGDEYKAIARCVQHVSFGTMHGLPTKATHNGLLFRDVIDQCRKTMEESLATDKQAQPDVLQGNEGNNAILDADECARLALVSQELSTKRLDPLNFTIGSDEKIDAPLDSYPGLCLQSWLNKLLSRSQTKVDLQKYLTKDLNLDLFGREESYADLLRLLARFPEIVEHAYEKLEPSGIQSYLLTIVEMLVTIWDGEQDASDSEDLTTEHDAYVDDETTSAQAHNDDVIKSIFFTCVRTVLENGMNYIGMTPVTERVLESPESAAVATSLAHVSNEDRPENHQSEDIAVSLVIDGTPGDPAQPIAAREILDAAVESSWLKQEPEDEQEGRVTNEAAQIPPKEPDFEEATISASPLPGTKEDMPTSLIDTSLADMATEREGERTHHVEQQSMSDTVDDAQPSEPVDNSQMSHISEKGAENRRIEAADQGMTENVAPIGAPGTDKA